MPAVTLLSQVCSAGWKYIYFSLQLSMNWNESVILFIGFWIDYYQNNSASIWEKVGLHRVHTLRVLSEHFFFPYYGWHFKIISGRQKIKNRRQYMAGLWGRGRGCAFLTCFLGERPPYKWKKKILVQYTKLWQNPHKQYSLRGCTLTASTSPAYKFTLN